MNSFGTRFALTTFGESHGAGIGCVIDGVPAGLLIDTAFVQSELDRRRPGGNRFGTTRNEPDTAEILSGVFEGAGAELISTGAPIAMLIRNSAAKSGDYDNLREVFRPSHADFSWFAKYGVRDHRGGGRTSARETAARVAAGAIAKLLLREVGAKVESGVFAVGGISAQKEDFEFAKTSEIFALDCDQEAAQKELIERVRSAHDSIGAAVKVRISGLKAGVGEPLYGKLDAQLAAALMGINAVKAVEIGAGAAASGLRGSENNDPITKNGFASNNAGGILGGVSTGQPITLTAHFKPTPSIFLPQQTINTVGDEVELLIKGRHDPCVGIRGAVVCEAMCALVCADLLLQNLGARVEHLRTIYA